MATVVALVAGEVLRACSDPRAWRPRIRCTANGAGTRVRVLGERLEVATAERVAVQVDRRRKQHTGPFRPGLGGERATGLVRGSETSQGRGPGRSRPGSTPSLGRVDAEAPRTVRSVGHAERGTSASGTAAVFQVSAPEHSSTRRASGSSAISGSGSGCSSASRQSGSRRTRRWPWVRPHLPSGECGHEPRRHHPARQHVTRGTSPRTLLRSTSRSPSSTSRRRLRPSIRRAPPAPRRAPAATVAHHDRRQRDHRRHLGVATALIARALPGLAALHLDRKGRGRALRAAWTRERRRGRRLHGRRPLDRPRRAAPAGRAARLRATPTSRSAPGSRRARTVARGPKRELISRALQPDPARRSRDPVPRRAVRLQGGPRRRRAGAAARDRGRRLVLRHRAPAARRAQRPAHPRGPGRLGRRRRQPRPRRAHRRRRPRGTARMARTFFRGRGRVDLGPGSTRRRLRPRSREPA